jgi:two-component system, NarL family, nitrate/nitrite response regulator NarL
MITSAFRSIVMTEVKALQLSERSCSNLLPFSSFDPEPVGDGHEPTRQAGDGAPLSRIETIPPCRSKDYRPISTAIIDKSLLFRVGLKSVLSGRRLRVTTECARLSDLPEQAFAEENCVVLLGLDADDQTDFTNITTIKRKHPRLRIIVLSEQFHPDQLLAAMESGANGYLMKNEISPDALLKSIELVLVGGVVVPSGFTKRLNSRSPVLSNSPPIVALSEHTPEHRQPEPRTDVAHADDYGRLSSRELLVLTHLTRGDSNKCIARVLNIAEATVKVHVKSLLRKIRVCNRTQAAMWAMTHVQSLDGHNLRPPDLPSG